MLHVLLRQPAGTLHLVLTAALALLAACGNEPGGEAYFPLAAGRTWHYEVERTTMDGLTPLRHVVASVAPPGGSAVSAVRETASGHRYLYTVDDGGIFRIGEQRHGHPPVPAAHGRSLVLPRELGDDSTWQSPTRTSVLENTGPPWETLFRIDVPLTLTYRVTSLDSEIETPAGHFSGCLLITGHGTTNADVGNYIGRTEIEITSREWFAPGVGLVRMERTETTSASAISAGSLTMQLAGWHER